ncbi:MAG: class I SAM-dependent methyltransferase [Caulobacteraceae bacterium]|nr:class I SAM-dependent methyltransferase [Caulobacter sp.]
MSWRGGYVADVAYTSGVYLETAPAHLSTCALLAGVRAPDPSAPFRYLDLGCGTGMGVCLLAAANPHGEFVGVDFNPAHVAAARALIAAAGLDNVRVEEAGFADLAGSRGEAQGRFDYAVAHGVWTWVGPQAQAELVAALDRRVRPGGLVYMGYNNMAGWAASLPLQRLIADHAARTPGDSLERIRAAVKFALGLRAAEPRGVDFSRLELQLKGALDDPDKAPAGLYAYLAHEYLNAHWRPAFPADVAEALADARLTYAGGADPFSVLPELTMTAAQAQAAQAYEDAAGRRALADLIAPTSFRQDVFVRGAQPLSPPRREAALRAVRLAAAEPLAERELTVEVPGGKLELDPQPYRAVCARLDRGPAEVGALLGEVEGAGRSMSATELLVVLVGSGMATPMARASAQEGTAEERARARRYNVAMVEALRDQAGLRLALASPLTGSGVRASLNDCLAYLAHATAPGRHPELDVPVLRMAADALAPFWEALRLL